MEPQVSSVGPRLRGQFTGKGAVTPYMAQFAFTPLVTRPARLKWSKRAQALLWQRKELRIKQ